jgi:hypothetical protein
MYRSKNHILYAKLMLAIFVIGQVILFTHQHEIGKCCGEVSFAHYLKNGYHAHKPEIQNCLLCEVITNKKILLNEFIAPKVYLTILHNPIIFICETVHIFKIPLQSRGPPLNGHIILQ